MQLKPRRLPHVESRTRLIIVRHVAGHTTHMHVRVRCAPNEKHCVASR